MILLADNNIDQLIQKKTALEKEGYEVITADSQKEAENIIKKIKPELAVFNLIMENDDSGFILSYWLKKKSRLIPVIICAPVSISTGISFGPISESDRRWIKADFYLEKETSMENFVKIVQKLLET